MRMPIHAQAFFSGPLLGRWADVRSHRSAILLSVVFGAVGSALYALAWSKWVLLAARVVIGMGAGRMVVCTSAVALVTSEQERTSAMAAQGAIEMVGMAFGPVRGSIVWGQNRFSAPGKE